VAEQNVPAIQLGKATQLDNLFQRLRKGDSLQAVLAGPISEMIVLQPDWQCPASIPQGYTIELSARGNKRDSWFLTLILEPRPAQFAFITFSQQQVNGTGGAVPAVDWGPNDWVRWSINVMGHEVTYRASKHASLRNPYFDQRPLDVRPPYTVRAIVIGDWHADSLSVAEVRLWDGLMCETLEDQHEFLGGHRLDGREPRLVGYWKLAEGSGTRLADSSRFGHDGTLHGGRWLDPATSGLKLDIGLEQVRNRREALYSLARRIRSTRQQTAGQRQELELANDEIRRYQAEQEEIEKRKRELSDLDRESEALEEEFRKWRQSVQDGGRVGLDDFSQSLAREVDEASTELIETKSPYQLQSVAFDVKTLPVQVKDQPDFLVTFPQPQDQQVQPGQLSTLSLSFQPRPPEPQRTEVIVPDVLGYTELAARRLLSQKGFQAQVLDQATDRSDEVDRVIDQQPKPGTSTGPEHSLHQPVTLFLGRASGSGGG
jgi:hypothetical protein